MNYPPLLPEIFDRLKSGYHISPEDDCLHGALMEHGDEYAAYFGALGFVLVRHERDFFYFEPDGDDAATERLAKIAVFAYILVDDTANRGLPVEATLLTTTLALPDLPHLSLDSYRARLAQVNIFDQGDLRDVVNHLKGLGWAKWTASDEFCLLRPFHRMLDRCLELARECGERVDESSDGLPGGNILEGESKGTAHA